MQTFLPYPDFNKSARCLDRLRLGKQRVETIQLLRAILSPTPTGWSNHPATKMWHSHPWTLAYYGMTMCVEWQKRGYQDTCLFKIIDLAKHIERTLERPSWLGDPAFHASHRSNLLRKDPIHYSQFGWTEPSDLPYLWPEPLM